MKRRDFATSVAGAVLGSTVLPGSITAQTAAQQRQQPADLPDIIRNLRPLPGQVVPISAAERARRIERARELMRQNQIDALIVEPGTTLTYFSTARWGTSERPFVMVLPQRGEVAWVAPAFEEARAREQTGQNADVRVWQEDESWARLIAGILRDRGAAAGKVGVEARVRFFVADGARAETPGAQFVSADPVSVGCRMIKSPAELALMQRATDITIAAYRATFQTMHEGMDENELARNHAAALSRLGGTGGYGLVLFGESSAYPHGSTVPRHLAQHDIVLIDSGCTVEGYNSDVTRTTTFGSPTDRQRRIWDLEKRAQSAALNAARVGAPCESVDKAARDVITAAGFGPDYKVPGLPHRTGHGIGLDGHESPNFVRGNTLPIQAGMCFSDEPTIAIYGEFGVRLEDCLHMTEEGPVLFSGQSESIERPV